MLPNVVMNLDDVGVVLARLMGQIPTGKALVVTVAGIRLVNERLVDLDLFPPRPPPPIEPRIVRSEVQL